MNATKDQIQKALELAIALTDTILVSVGENGIPNGHLYARMMGTLSFDQYVAFLGRVKRMGFVEESGNFLTLTESGRKALDNTKARLAAEGAL